MPLWQLFCRFKRNTTDILSKKRTPDDDEMWNLRQTPPDPKVARRSSTLKKRATARDRLVRDPAQPFLSLVVPSRRRSSIVSWDCILLLTAGASDSLRSGPSSSFFSRYGHNRSGGIADTIIAAGAFRPLAPAGTFSSLFEGLSTLGGLGVQLSDPTATQYPE